MSYYIKIQRLPYEEPNHLQLVWETSNGNVTTCFDYYDNESSLLEIAEKLENFPQDINNNFIYELGSENPKDRFAYYFRFRAFTTDARGSSAIQIRFSYNYALPYREMVEFCIQTEPSAINRLGRLFREFSKLTKDYLVWSEKDDFVGDKYEYA